MFGRIFTRLAIVKEFVEFFWVNKLWWAIPIIVLFLIVVFAIFLSHPATLIPFSYSLF